MRMNIKSNAPELQSKIDDLVKRQMPFALSLALNTSIQRVRDETLRHAYNRAFQPRNKAFFKQVHQIRNSAVGHVRKTGMAIASIQQSSLPAPAGTRKKSTTRAAYTDFMVKHVRGGMKTPEGARNIAIPIEKNVTRRKGGAKAGAVNNSLRPKTVMGTNKGFIFESNGKKYLGRRKGRDGKDVQVLYSLRKTANIKRAYDPQRIVKRGMRQFFTPMYKRAWIKALKTAKLR